MYIPLPTTLHEEWVGKAAAVGKHIICEKPLAVTAAEIKGMIDVCKSSNVLFMDGTMFMHLDRTKRVVEAKKQLGKIRKVVSSFCFCGDENFHKNDIRTKKDCDALGALGDLGWYSVKVSMPSMHS